MEISVDTSIASMDITDRQMLISHCKVQSCDLGNQFNSINRSIYSVITNMQITPLIRDVIGIEKFQAMGIKQSCAPTIMLS
jgi:hypothetical protein